MYLTDNKDIEIKFVSLDYAEDLYHLIDKNRNVLSDWFAWCTESYDLQSTKEFIAFCQKEFIADHSCQGLIFYQGQLCGGMALNHIDLVHHWVSIGYWLGQEFQKKGIVSRALDLIIPFAFKNYHTIERVEALVDVNNSSSQKVIENKGFHFEGTLRAVEKINNEMRNLKVYSLLRTDVAAEKYLGV